VVRAPRQLARRLAQIGIVEAADGPRLQALLAPGQRLVTRDGALWRWDGLTASADAPTAAALRLAQKNRLAELEGEALAATKSLRAAEALAATEAAVRQRVETEKAARQAWRDAQNAVGAARDALAKAERAAGELVSRRSALDESRTRLAESHAEAVAAHDEAAKLFAAAPDVSELQASLDRASAAVAGDRGALAEARAAHDGLKRDTEAREKRLRQIADERETWVKRAENADRQIASLSERRAEAQAELRSLEDIPDEIDAKRRALLSQLKQAEDLRKEAADRLQGAENAAGRARQGRHRRHSGAVRIPRGQGARRGTADRRRRAPPRGRGAHSGGVGDPAASRDPPDGARA
jgi:chromosome segregation protein